MFLGMKKHPKSSFFSRTFLSSSPTVVFFFCHTTPECCSEIPSNVWHELFVHDIEKAVEQKQSSALAAALAGPESSFTFRRDGNVVE